MDRRRIRALPADELYAFLWGCRENLESPLHESPELRARDNVASAVFMYAMGDPLDDVKRHARDGITHFLALHAKRRSLEQLTEKRKGFRWDDSVTASNETLTYLYWGLMLRDEERLRALAACTWDPPPPFVPAHPIFRVAYAVRDLVLGRSAEALSQLERIRPTAKKHVLLQAKVLHAIAREAPAEVASAIGELARTHRVAMVNDYLPELKMFCRSSGGLASLAFDRGLLTERDFPEVDSFPGELVLGSAPSPG